MNHELPESPDSPGAAPSVPVQAGQTWIQRLGSVLLMIFCFELGLFLLIYPWTGGWSQNYLGARWRGVWDNSYIRGGLSGLGLVNLWIAMGELFRMFARRS
jgi:hypothetical protein